MIGKLLLDRNNAIAFVYGISMRNLSIALAIVLTIFGEQGAEMALIIALAFVFQIPAAAWYLKVTDRILGQVSDSTPPMAAHLVGKET